MATQSNESIRSLTLEVIDNYRKTANITSRTLLATSARGIGMVSNTLSGYYDTKIGNAVKSALDKTQGKIVLATDKADEAIGYLGGAVKNGLATTENTIVTAVTKADGAVSKLLDGASSRVAKFPPKGSKLASLMKLQTFQTVESLGLPGAKALRFVSQKLVDGAEQVSAKVVSEKKPAPARKKAAPKTVARKTAVRKTAAKKSAAKA